MAQNICSIVMDDGTRCVRPAVARGMCYLHLSRERSGTPMGQPIGPQAKPVVQCEHCDRLAEYSTLCAAHYQQQRLGITPRRVFRRGISDAEKVDVLLGAGTSDKKTGCIFADRIGRDGYATSIKDFDGHPIKVHRLVYRERKGPIPDGEQIHHTCGVRACINPDHLERATQRENVGEMLARLSYERQIKALNAEVRRLRKTIKELQEHHE